MSASRTYLDWNATAPVRPEARAAMIAAMDVVGNPSSVHAEGREAKGIVEKAREQIAQAFGAQDADIVFTSGATEAAALALAGQGIHASRLEHSCVAAWCENDLTVDTDGHVAIADPAKSTLQAANSETGLIHDLPQGLYLTDAVQAFGKIPFAFSWTGARMALLTGHKIGAPKGVGALVMQRGTDIAAQIKGGGQEMGRRSGTENIIGLAGFGAAAEAAARDLDNGVWDQVAELRDLLEAEIADQSPDTICVSKGKPRLPNTSYMLTPGWKGQTQVMQMDLAGYAVSAGSACSSGKVKASGVLLAMGYPEDMAGCALRVSLGPTTTKDDVLGFARAWGKTAARHLARAV